MRGKARVELTLNGPKGSGRLTALLVKKSQGSVKVNAESKDDWEVVTLLIQLQAAYIVGCYCGD